MIGLVDVREAASRIAGRVMRTPTIEAATISRATGAEVWLKLENLQAIGSFKERGAANRLALLSAGERARGVVAMSAGNHAQAVARHASLAGIAAIIVMPRFTPLGKISRTQGWGATVLLEGETLAEAAEHAAMLAEQRGLVLIHPYDDPAVMAGQGTLALEMLEDMPTPDALLVPIGGGGMIAGCAAVAAALSPATDMLGVSVDAYASISAHFGGAPRPPGGATIAEGIAVREVGQQPLAVIRAHVRDVLVVPERAVECAIALLAEGAKLVAEGAGAIGVAALLAYPERFRGKRVGTVICGGNIDARILANVLLRNLLRDGRLLRLFMEIPDRPGVLADIATRIANCGGNIIDVSHHRLFAAPSVQAAELEVMVEVRDPAHADAITEVLAESYRVRRQETVSRERAG